MLSEDLHPATGELWGNIPQTYSMAGLINSAMTLSRRWEDAWSGPIYPGEAKRTKPQEHASVDTPQTGTLLRDGRWTSTNGWLSRPSRASCGRLLQNSCDAAADAVMA